MNTVGDADMITDLRLGSVRERIWRERFEQHLDQIPQLLEIMREQRVPLAAARSDSERVSGGGGSNLYPSAPILSMTATICGVRLSSIWARCQNVCKTPLQPLSEQHGRSMARPVACLRGSTGISRTARATC